MTGKYGVAISTTGEEHRLGFLETSVRAWRAALPAGSVLVVTVDGSVAETLRVGLLLGPSVDVRRVGQIDIGVPLENRMGVAVNKNTGIELLMSAKVRHLFLSDDDTWPRCPQALTKHTDFPYSHSVVCWGSHRLLGVNGHTATWSWPRGVMLYAHATVINRVGGMVEAFGPGGHEHVEWSQRIHNATGFTPAPFVTPTSYATRNGMGATALWHAEDMPKAGEKFGDHRLRRKKITTVHRAEGDWERIEDLMRAQEGSSAFVPFSAHENGRASATLCADLPSQGSRAVEPDSRGEDT